MRPEDAGEDLARTIDAPDPGQIEDVAAVRLYVYSFQELIAFERDILRTMRDLRERAPEEIHSMIDLSNIRPMEQLIEQLQLRADQWARRVEALTN